MSDSWTSLILRGRGAVRHEERVVWMSRRTRPCAAILICLPLHFCGKSVTAEPRVGAVRESVTGR